MVADTAQSLYGTTFGPGALVGAYVVEEHFCEGGFASIYRATHERTGQVAALKVLRSDLAASVRMIQRFQQEARALQALAHPDIVEVHEVGELTDGRPYLAMEWLAGRNLAEEIRARGALSVPEALAVVEKLGSALAAAHGRGIVHRDLKAQNVMCVPAGEWFDVRLVNFGIAKVSAAPGDDPWVVTNATVLGTPQTMAPEQILGQPVDGRTDIYALGLLLYQMVTGQLPFDGANAVEIEEMHLCSVPPPPSEMAAVSAEIDLVVARALAKDPDERYQTVAAMIEDLRRAVAGEHGDRDSNKPPGARWRPRNCAPRRRDISNNDSTGPEIAGEAEAKVAVYVEVKLPADSGQVEDGAFDYVDDVLGLAQERFEAAGMTTTLETASGLLLADSDAGLSTACASARAEAIVRIAREMHATALAGRPERVSSPVVVAVDFTPPENGAASGGGAMQLAARSSDPSFDGVVVAPALAA